jgi:hypothetical protein
MSTWRWGGGGVTSGHVRHVVVQLIEVHKLSDKNIALSFHTEKRPIECKPSDSHVGMEARLVKLYAYLAYFLICYLTTPSIPKIK